MEFNTSKKIKKPKKSYFMGCFGFSIIEKEFNKSTISSSKKKKTKSNLLCLSKIIRKHSSSAKTIPVDISDKFDNSSREIHVVKTTEKVKTPVIAGEVTQSPVVKSKSQTNIVHDHKVVNKTKDHKTKDTIHKNNKSLDQLLDKVHDDNLTCQNEFSRSVTISTTHNLSSHLINSTKDKHEIKKLLSHSTSLPVPPPPPKRKKPVAETATRSKVNTNEKSSSSQRHVSSDNFDSIIGMSILMVTLLIMLFWGKACAIVCTCAWFYFIPRVRPEKNEAIVAGKKGVLDEDVNSEEYKKKVVLEGLLKRNHRNGVEFL